MLGDHAFLRVDGSFLAGGLEPRIGGIGLQLPGLDVVRQVDFEDVLADLAAQFGIEDGGQDLDAVVEVALPMYMMSSPLAWNQ